MKGVLRESAHGRREIRYNAPAMRGRWQGKPDAGGDLGARAGLAILCALATALAAPLAAQAATKVGQTPPPGNPQEGEPSMLPTLCQGKLNLVQSAAVAAPLYSVPAAGVITSWSHRGATLASGTAGQGKLAVWRPAGTDSYTAVGKSAAEAFTANTVGTFKTRVPVKAGDLLGLRTQTDGVACFFSNFEGSSMEDVVGFQSGFPHEQPEEPPTEPPTAPDPEPGTTYSFEPVHGSGGRVNVAAVVEPDADGDGFGDETQDLCPTDASAQGACPPPPPPPELPGPPPDFTPPDLALFGKPSQPFRKLVRVAAVCASEACDVFATGRLIVRPPARSGRRGPRRIRGFKLGPAQATMGAGEKTALRLKVRRPAQVAAAKALNDGGSVRALVRVRAVDEAGNDAYARKGVSLGKNPRKGKRR